MALTTTSYDACTAAGRGLVPRGLAGGCFASGKILLEQNGALSTL